MKKIIKIVPVVFLMMALFVSCTGGINGTYVPKNEAAKQMQFSKFVFKGGKVQCYMGTMGIALPVSSEYSYKMNGNTVSIEDGSGRLELNYDKNKQELSMMNGLAVWGKE